MAAEAGPPMTHLLQSPPPIPEDRDPTEARRRVQDTANASGMKARTAARNLMTDLDRLTPPDQLARLDAISDLLAEVHRWKDAWAAEHVDKDRQVRAAMARSAQCAEHGHIIAALEGQVTHVDHHQARTEAARLVMLAWYHACQDIVTAARSRERDGGELPTGAAILAWMEAQLPKVHVRHQRVFAASVGSKGGQS